MHSFTELNGYNDTTELTFTDYRSASIIFNSEIGSNQHIGLKQGKNHILPLGLDILDIISGQELDIKFKINFNNFLPGSVDFGTLPDGLTLTQESNEYTISGLSTKEQWDTIKYPTIISNTANNGDYNYKIDITYLLNGDKSWLVYLTVELGIELESLYTVYCNGYKLVSIPTYMASSFSIYSESIRKRTNNLQFQSIYSQNILGTRCGTSVYNLNSLMSIYELAQLYVVTIGATTDNYYTSGTNELLENPPSLFVTYDTSGQIELKIEEGSFSTITNITTSGSGGTVVYNNSTRILIITGTLSQVISHVNTIVLHTTASYDYRFKLYYTLTDLTTGIHRTSNDQTILPRNTFVDDPQYQINFDVNSSQIPFLNIPHINNTESGNYTLEIIESNNNLSLAYLNQNNNDAYGTSSVANSNTILAVAGNGTMMLVRSNTTNYPVYLSTSTGLDTFIANISTGYRASIDFYGNNVILHQKLYTKSGSSWSNILTLPSQATNVTLSYDGNTITYNDFVSSTLSYLKCYKKINGSWTLLPAITFNNTFRHVCNSNGNKLAIYSSLYVYFYRFNELTQSFDLVSQTNNLSYNSMNYFYPGVLSDDGSRLLLWTGAIGAQDRIGIILENINGSWTRISDSFLSSGWEPMMSDDGNICYNGNYEVWKYYNNTWNRIGTDFGFGRKKIISNSYIYDIDGTSPYYRRSTSIIYNNITFDYANKKITIVDTYQNINDLINNKFYFNISSPQKTGDFYIKYKITSPSGLISYRYSKFTGI